jgi:alpha-glucosidase (family GH31 glycosyl hydrolase)
MRSTISRAHHLIDSPWSWRYNDFKVDEDRYPEPEKFFRGLQAQGYRVVLWMTCMVWTAIAKDTKAAESRTLRRGGPTATRPPRPNEMVEGQGRIH